ncbi:Ig-like domain-containing protein [Bifidobacterium thermacidophilum]|uniref:Ig-like domain-containing protein n=1 Tax=Bifidobacterium thermacidophilum TaxID=246618 RepID=UPI0005C46433|nr:Ig-like domain-containing protein [Bifidobacterium thermacidophilum]
MRAPAADAQGVARATYFHPAAVESRREFVHRESDTVIGGGVAGCALAITAGKTVQLGVNGKTVTMSDEKWWSDGTAVTVLGTGLIVGVTAGTSTVSVTTGDATYQLAVMVK